MTDFTFRQNRIIDECPVCGLRFAHGHKDGDKPNMFFVVHDEVPVKPIEAKEQKKFVPSDHLPKKNMTKSQRLRAVLWKRWAHEIGKKGKISAEDFYNREMDRITDIEISKL